MILKFVLYPLAYYSFFVQILLFDDSICMYNFFLCVKTGADAEAPKGGHEGHVRVPTVPTVPLPLNKCLLTINKKSTFIYYQIFLESYSLLLYVVDSYSFSL